MANHAPIEVLQGGQLNAAISNAVVHAFSDYIGRGPTKARTSIRDDLVVCLLENGLTKAERSLVAGGREQLVSTPDGRFSRPCGATSSPRWRDSPVAGSSPS
jgi:hypothetical protein